MIGRRDKNCFSRLILLIFMLLPATAALAESEATTSKVCHDGFSHPTTLPPPGQAEPAWRFHTLEECAVDLFTIAPFGPAVGNVGTGSGLGGGFHAQYAPNGSHQVWSMKALYSINSSYIVSGRYRRTFSNVHVLGVKKIKNTNGQLDQISAVLDVNAVRIDLRTQDFYGIGPNSTLAGHAVYRQQEWWTGVNGYRPLAYSGPLGMLGIFGEAQYFQTVTKGVSGDSLPSVNALYGESEAPASLSRPDFLEAGGGLSIRTPTSKPILWESHLAAVKYDHYFEQGSKQFSFDRLEGWGHVDLQILHSKKTDPKQRFAPVNLNGRPWWKDALCMKQAIGGCEAGKFTLGGRVTTSYTSVGSNVPFYLQPTLGGADFDGVDTLRGLVDYRLRAPNRMLMQVDFDKAIAQARVKGKPIGEYGLYAFFDAGNVSNTPGALLDNGLRKDVGVGASIAIQNKVVLRFYIAFGAGEGSHPNAKFGNAFSNGNTAAVP
jgi:hypothetical protein